jgi:uroporphyrinogen-III synthase
MSSLPLAGVSVAITRPRDQAKKLTHLIESAGGHVILFPLIEIVALDDVSPFEHVIAKINDYDWVVFISSNAVQHGMPHLLKQTIPRELKDFGVEDVLIPEGRFDSESLLSMPQLQDMQGKKVMIVRGVGGREVLADTLKSRGATVTFAECYQRINPQDNIELLAKAWSNEHLKAIVVTSSEAMRHLLDLAKDASWLKQVTLCVNHARIAEQPLAMGLKVKIAGAPGDEAMIKSLLSLR